MWRCVVSMLVRPASALGSRTPNAPLCWVLQVQFVCHFVMLSH